MSSSVINNIRQFFLVLVSLHVFPATIIFTVISFVLIFNIHYLPSSLDVFFSLSMYHSVYYCFSMFFIFSIPSIWVGVTTSVYWCMWWISEHNWHRAEDADKYQLSWQSIFFPPALVFMKLTLIFDAASISPRFLINTIHLIKQENFNSLNSNSCRMQLY